MAIEQRLDIKLDQKLVMTPQLRMAIKLLQMPTLDVQSFINQELMENPCLKVDDGTSETEVAHLPADSNDDDSSERENNDSLHEDSLADVDFGWEDMYDSGHYNAPRSNVAPEDQNSWEQNTAADISLKDHLRSQLGMITDDAKLSFIGYYLIDLVDDAGYLKIDVADIAKQLNVDTTTVQNVVDMLHGMDPAGVGARDLAECLRIQLEQQNALSATAACVLDNLQLLAQHDFKRLRRLAKCDEAELFEVVEKITALTPKPGLKYGSDHATNVIPDVIIRRKNGRWQADLNADAMPKLLLSGRIDKIMQKSSGEEKEYFNERMSRAQWLMKSLEQRAQTIYKVANAIVEAQSDIFSYGLESLQPMTLKQVAEKVGVHESTVSRVTNGKYMQTPLGVFELKYFFSAAIGTTGGNMQVAAEGVKFMIKRLVESENPAKPLSDEKLVQLLKQDGIDVARRTVAKYREMLNIPSSSGRRVRAS